LPDDIPNINEIISGLLADLAVRTADRIWSLGRRSRATETDPVEDRVRKAIGSMSLDSLPTSIDNAVLSNFLTSPDLSGVVDRLVAFRLVAHLDPERQLTHESRPTDQSTSNKRKAALVRQELEDLRRSARSTAAPEKEGDAVRRKWLETTLKREASAASKSGATTAARNEALRRECRRTTELWLGPHAPAATVVAVNDAILVAADIAYDAISELHVSGSTRRSLERWLSSVEPRVQLLDGMSSLAPALKYENELRVQAIERHKWMKAPHLGQGRLELESNYVEPQFRRWPSNDSVDSVTAYDLTSALDRTVVVGNPGAGKTSFASSVCYTVANQYQAAVVSGRLLTPLMVPLRDIAHDIDEYMIEELLERVSRVHYQIGPPNEALQYLLVQGRLLVIFDGLDEVQDVSEREAVRDSIELFCDRYPLTPVLVTARDIGYEHAELSRSKFTTFLLEEFGEEQITQYVERWFANDEDIAPDARKQTAEAFLQESEQHAADLRRNPLLLTLLCGVYSGPGKLPTSRPAVYRECIDLLLRRWDAIRRMEVRDPLEQHLERTLREVASWLYKEPEFAEGMPEDYLVRRCAMYLAEIRTDDEEEAQAVAQSFVDFCRDRAWVLVKTGYDTNGTSLFGFAHRTFLEYFAAQRLEKQCRTAADLATTLSTLVDDSASVVPHLALQLADDSRDDAGDDVLKSLMGDAEEESESPERQLRLLVFVADALRYLVPRPSTTRRLARETARGLLEPTVKDTTNYSGAVETSPWPTIAEHLGFAAERNIKATAHGFAEGLVRVQASTDARQALSYLFAGVASQPTFIVEAWRTAMPDLFEGREMSDSVRTNT
jgi:NACHT domain